MVGASVWFEAERARGRAQDSGRTIAVLANAARHHVQADYEVLVSSGPQTLDTRGDFADADILPRNFVFADEMKRDVKVLVLPSPTGVRALSGQFPGAGDDRRAVAGLTEGLDGQYLGMVETAAGRCPGVTPPCLVGPGVTEELGTFASNFPDETLVAGALMVLYEYEHDDWCGEFLHRTDTNRNVPNFCPDPNRLEQDITVAGSIMNAAAIEQFQTIELNGPLTVGRELNVSGQLSSASARMTAGSGLNVGSADVSGNYGGENEACEVPSVLSAVCNKGRVIVAGTILGGTTTINVEGGGAPPVDGDADMGDLEAGCIQVDGTVTVQGRVRVVKDNRQAKGSC